MILKAAAISGICKQRRCCPNFLQFCRITWLASSYLSCMCPYVWPPFGPNLPAETSLWWWWRWCVCVYSVGKEVWKCVVGTAAAGSHCIAFCTVAATHCLDFYCRRSARRGWDQEGWTQWKSWRHFQM